MAPMARPVVRGTLRTYRAASRTVDRAPTAERTSSVRGFTLLELLIVMVVMAVAAVIVMPSVRSGVQQREVRLTLQKFVSAVRYSSARAIMDRRSVDLVLWPEQASYSVEGLGDDRELPEAASFGELVGGRHIGGGEVTFEFYPTGGSSGGAIELLFETASGRQTYTLVIDPLISRVEVQRAD